MRRGVGVCVAFLTLEMFGLSAGPVEAQAFRWPPHCGAPVSVEEAQLCAQLASNGDAHLAQLWSAGSLILSVLTLVAVIVGFIQTSRNSQSEFRAYLGMKIDQLVLQDNSTCVLQLSITNSGRTPCVEGEVLLNFRYLPPDTTKNSFKKITNIPTHKWDCEYNVYEMQSGEQFFSGEDIINVPFSSANIQDLYAGKGSIYIQIHAWWRDIFGKISRSTTSQIYGISKVQSERKVFVPTVFWFGEDGDDVRSMRPSLRPQFRPTGRK